MNDEEKDFVRRFDLTPEAYRRGKKAFEEQDGRPDHPSSWDSVLTFDSVKAKRAKRAAAEAAKKGSAA